MAGEVYAALATEQGKKSESPFDGVMYSTKDDGRVKTETIEIRTPKAAEQFKKPDGHIRHAVLRRNLEIL